MIDRHLPLAFYHDYASPSGCGTSPSRKRTFSSNLVEVTFLGLWRRLCGLGREAISKESV